MYIRIDASMRMYVGLKMVIKTPLVQKLPRYLATLPQSVFTEGQLSQIIEDYAKVVNDPFDAATAIYLQYMVEKGLIREIVVVGEKRRVKRYLTSPQSSLPEIACSLQHNSYLSHLSAAYLHEWIKKEPPMTYVSTEGPQREIGDNDLTQEKIDAAFQKPQRRSGATMRWENNHFLLLSGSYAGGVGIEQRGNYSLTSIERTLIDLTVRPAYGGGAKNILTIYQRAAPVLDIGQLFTLLEKLAYKYPYHQSIGFYLSLAGYPDRKELQKLKKIGMRHHFYLEYELIDPVYSDEWNIFFPRKLILENHMEEEL